MELVKTILDFFSHVFTSRSCSKTDFTLYRSGYRGTSLSDDVELFETVVTSYSKRFNETRLYSETLN